MSKHEPRAAEIKAEAKEMGIKVSWSRRRSVVYLHVTQPPNPNSFAAGVRHEIVQSWLSNWYPDADMTSWTTTHGTFKVFDIWEELKK